jgi:hypothetical protein
MDDIPNGNGNDDIVWMSFMAFGYPSSSFCTAEDLYPGRHGFLSMKFYFFYF